MPARTATQEQINIISENWQTCTIPQLMEKTGLTRHLTIGVCQQLGLIPMPARRTADYASLHVPNPRKIKRYGSDDKNRPKIDDPEEEKKPMVRHKAEYSNGKSLYKELQ